MSQVIQTSDFYPRPPRGGRPDTTTLTSKALKISIHALREEGDQNRTKDQSYQLGFLSTPSARRATAKFDERNGDFEISIHALREEGDSVAPG